MYMVACPRVELPCRDVKQLDVDLQGGGVVDGSFSCGLVESHSGPLHVIALHFCIVSCLTFGISAPWPHVCFESFGLAIPTIIFVHNKCEIFVRACIIGTFSLVHENEEWQVETSLI